MSTNVIAVAEPTVLDVPGTFRALEVGLVRGRVDVIAGDGPARVEVHALTGRPLEVSTNGGVLRVGYRGTSLAGILGRLKGFGAEESADVQITVPAAVDVSLAVVKADGLVAGFRGDTKVSTVSGPVVVDQCTGALTASTVAGELVVRDHTGRVSASSVSGTLTVSGDVPDITASTVSGDLTVDLTVTPRTAKLSGVSGDVVLRAPDAGALRLRLNAAGGRVTVDGVEHIDTRHKGIVLDVGGARGVLGTAVISSVSGDVTVLTRVARPADADADADEEE